VRDGTAHVQDAPVHDAPVHDAPVQVGPDQVAPDQVEPFQVPVAMVPSVAIATSLHADPVVASGAHKADASLCRTAAITRRGPHVGRSKASSRCGAVGGWWYKRACRGDGVPKRGGAMSDWFSQQRGQFQSRQRQMQGAWWQQKQRERAEAERRVRDDAAKRTRARKERQRAGDEPTGWRPHDGLDGQKTSGPPATPTPVSRSRGFVRELPRRLLRLALTAVVFVSFAIAFTSDIWSEDADTAFVAILVGFVALVVVGRLQAGRRGSIDGIATHVVPMPGTGPTPSRLTFRVERYDSRGGRLAPVPVEMTGGNIKGQLLDGDEIRLEHSRVRGGAYHPRRVVNLRTGETVQLGRRFGYWLGMAISWIVFLAIIGFIIAIVVGSG
jgi:hypothetical protein